MKPLIYTFLFVSLLNPALAQVFDMDTLIWSGSETNRLNMVILSDGYQESEFDKFSLDALNFTDALFQRSPYKEYAGYFNVVLINVPSNESGASHPGTATDVNEPVFPVATVDNYFGSAFDAYNIHRLLVPANTIGAYTVLANNFPTYDIVIMLVNSPYYGGSGGPIATASTEESSDEVAIHELGHSFANLSDEYYAGDFYAGESVNMTQVTDPDLVKWHNWYGDSGIGIYQHSGGGNASSWYRPHQNCQMRFLGRPFCAVCRQATVERIHQLISPVDGYAPETGNMLAINDSLQFTLSLVKPNPNTLKTVWSLNGENLAAGTDSVMIYFSDLSAGIHELEVMIEDTSAYLRVDDHAELHFNSILWTIDATTSKIVDVQNADYAFSVFPNPAANEISVSFEASIPGVRIITITDLQGRQIYRQELSAKRSPAIIDIQNLTPGTYLLGAAVEGRQPLQRKFVKH